MASGVYLDWAATTPPHPDVLGSALSRAVADWGNPSSAHAAGRAAKASLEEARKLLLGSLEAAGAAHVGPASRIVFTATGTEADQIPLLAALRGHLTRPNSCARILVSEVEHAAVWAQAELLGKFGIAVDTVRPREDGRIHPEDVAARLHKDTALVAVMAVNNETGAINDLAGISDAIARHAAGIGRKPPHFHADCVQALGKVPLSLKGLSSAAFSAHKLRGPKGSGALYLSLPAESISPGGGQEGGLRSGTESLQAAWGMALAAHRATSALSGARAHALALESALIRGISSIPGARIVPECREAGNARWSPFIVSIAFPGLSGEVFERALSDSGFFVSTGSACSQARHARKPGASKRRILDAMGVPPGIALSAIRVSTGEDTTVSEIDRFLENASTLYRRLKT